MHSQHASPKISKLSRKIAQFIMISRLTSWESWAYMESKCSLPLDQLGVSGKHFLKDVCSLISFETSAFLQSYQLDSVNNLFEELPRVI